MNIENPTKQEPPTNEVEEVVSKQDKLRQSNASTLEPGAEFTTIYKSEKLKNTLSPYIKGKTLIDLGCGYATSMISFSIWCEAQKYIGVDLLNASHFRTEDDGKISGKGLHTPDHREWKNRNAYFFEEDILRYVSKLPDGSGNITLNGIDSNIVNSHDYIKLLAQHILRVIPEGGVVFGTKSDMIFRELLNLGFIEVDISEQTHILGFFLAIRPKAETEN